MLTSRLLIFLLVVNCMVISHADSSELQSGLQPVKQLHITHNTGSVEGGQLLFITVEEQDSHNTLEQTAVTCLFDHTDKVVGQFDKQSHQYSCVVPQHSRPETVSLQITINGTADNTSRSYVYTTHGKYDAPVTEIHIKKLQQRAQWIRAQAIDNEPNLHLQGIATHFCCLDEDDLDEFKKQNQDNKTVLQKKRFDHVVQQIHAAGVGLDAIIHASSSDGLRYGLEPVYYDMMRIGTMLFENPDSNNKNYRWKTTILQIKTLPKDWCLNYGCEETLDANTRVALIGHIPDDEVSYSIQGKPVNKLLDHEVVVVLDISDFPDTKVGDEVMMTFSGDDSPLDTSYSAPTTLN